MSFTLCWTILLMTSFCKKFNSPDYPNAPIGNPSYSKRQKCCIFINMSIYNVACSVNTFRKYSSIFYYRHANVRPMTGLRKATTARNLKHFYKCVHQLQGIPFPLRRQCSSCITLLAALTGHQCNFIAQQSNGIVIHRGPLIRLHKNTVPKQSVHQSLRNL